MTKKVMDKMQKKNKYYTDRLSKWQIMQKKVKKNKDVIKSNKIDINYVYKNEFKY